MRQKITTFRLTDEDLDILDRIATHMEETSGLRVSRADAVRCVIRVYARSRRIPLPRREKKTSEKNGKKA